MPVHTAGIHIPPPCERPRGFEAGVHATYGSPPRALEHLVGGVGGRDAHGRDVHAQALQGMEGGGMKSRSDGPLAQADRPCAQADYVVGVFETCQQSVMFVGLADERPSQFPELAGIERPYRGGRHAFPDGYGLRAGGSVAFDGEHVDECPVPAHAGIFGIGGIGIDACRPWGDAHHDVPPCHRLVPSRMNGSKV